MTTRTPKPAVTKRPSAIDLANGCLVRPRTLAGLVRRASVVSVGTPEACFRVSRAEVLRGVRRMIGRGVRAVRVAVFVDELIVG